MSPRTKLIIDTDPGVDDILAMLLALSASPEELEVLLITVTYGNVGVQNCLRNVVSLFHIINKEQEWRREHGRPEGFDMLKAIKPTVAVGASEPLTDQLMMADFFHGEDGIQGVHSSLPHLSPSDTWKALFKQTSDTSSTSEVVDAKELQAAKDEHKSFTPSPLPAHKQILRTLSENDPDTITILAIGPMTNLALAAAEDPETFLRVKEVVIMGGAVDAPGNMTPLAEFNIHSDAFAAARLFALTSPTPSSTMPPTPSHLLSSKFHEAGADAPPPYLKPYPEHLSAEYLRISLLPLDITTRHVLSSKTFQELTEEVKGSPLLTWVSAFLEPTFARSPEGTMALHDPLAAYFAMTLDGAWIVEHGRDVRIEAAGQWTRGACISDKRGREKKERGKQRGDTGDWLDLDSGNRISVVKDWEPGEGEGKEEVFGREMVELIFGVGRGHE